MLDATRSKFAARLHRLMPKRIVRRFVRQQDGMAAVEFALVAVPFLALLFAIFQTALFLFADQTLEAAIANSARLLQTGQAQTKGFSQDDFKNSVCGRLKKMFDCASGLSVDVRTYPTFGAIATGVPIKDGKVDTTKLTYKTATPGQIVVVSVYYQWPRSSLLCWVLLSRSKQRRSSDGGEVGIPRRALPMKITS